MHNNSFFKPLLFLVSILLFVSCDKEYSAVGDALIGDNNFELTNTSYPVYAYNQDVFPVQSNNLSVNSLGIYKSVFGKTTANYVTQVVLENYKPTFINPVIDSVYIEVPYFIDSKTADPKGGNTYVLDSIYGKDKAEIKLGIYESGRYMGNDKNGASQVFYTNQKSIFEPLLIGNKLNDNANVAQNDKFYFNPKQHTFTSKDASGNEVKTYSAPSMRLRLNNEFFKTKIFDTPPGNLAAYDVFIDHFKGLYFKVEQSGTSEGSLGMLDFSKGKITIVYKQDESLTNSATKVNKTLVLNLAGNKANLIEDENAADYNTALTSSSSLLGDEKLYIKGGEGSLVVLELFDKKDILSYNEDGMQTIGPNGVSDELDAIRKNGWLINDAKLVFNIDASLMANSSFEPDRIFVYDFDTKGRNGYNIIGSGAITKDANKKGVSYTVRIADYISYLVKNKTVTNVKLGLSVRGFKDGDVIFNELQSSVSLPFSFTQVPKASVMNPLGTILYGGRSTSNPTDKNLLKLEIYYTKPK